MERYGDDTEHMDTVQAWSDGQNSGPSCSKLTIWLVNDLVIRKYAECFC